MGAPAPALNQAVARAGIQGMADLVQGVTEEMVGWNKHMGAGVQQRLAPPCLASCSRAQDTAMARSPKALKAAGLGFGGR